MDKKFNYLVRLINRMYSSVQLPISFALQQAGGVPNTFGSDDPAFTITVNDAKGLDALCSLDATTVAEAYMAGRLDIQGEILQVFALRSIFTDRHPLHLAWRFLRPLIIGQLSNDKKSISGHYDYDSDFYRSFLDSKHRCYSQGVFVNDDEPLEDAMTRKLDFAIESTGLKRGDRVLDIGAGWGAFVEHAGRKGINVTGLTISAQSEKFVADLISKETLPCEIRREHFYEHTTDQPYDAIVNCGVTEHLPDYRKTLAKYRELLIPGGSVYLDASAARGKYRSVTFGSKHIFSSNHTNLCLHDFLKNLANTRFQLKGVYDDGHSYFLTVKHWAENLERNQSVVTARWGEALYRKFQIYLWGCVDNFVKDRFQAYRMVLHLPQ